ncbi:MAG: hypothetical protein ACK5T0_06050 [Vampirovibrionales bacterium]
MSFQEKPLFTILPLDPLKETSLYQGWVLVKWIISVFLSVFISVLVMGVSNIGNLVFTILWTHRVSHINDGLIFGVSLGVLLLLFPIILDLVLKRHLNSTIYTIYQDHIHYQFSSPVSIESDLPFTDLVRIEAMQSPQDLPYDKGILLLHYKHTVVPFWLPADLQKVRDALKDLQKQAQKK